MLIFESVEAHPGAGLDEAGQGFQRSLIACYKEINNILILFPKVCSGDINEPTDFVWITQNVSESLLCLCLVYCPVSYLQIQFVYRDHTCLPFTLELCSRSFLGEVLFFLPV